MQHESAAQACTHIRSVPAESGAKVIKVCSRESTLVVAKAWRIVCEGHISRLVKSFKSTMAHLPGQSGRSYISRSSEAATQNQRVKALPRGCGSSFSYVQNRPWKVMATLKVLQVNLCCLRERKSHGRESSKKSLVKERQKACGMKAPRKYGAPPESFAKMIRKKSVPAKATTVQSQKCGE